MTPQAATRRDEPPLDAETLERIEREQAEAYEAALRDSGDYAARHKTPPAKYPDEKLKLTIPLVVVGVHDFLSAELPAREEILSPWLLTQSLNMVYAWRGVGKTQLALNLAYAIATGGEFLTWKSEKPRKVLYIDGEMPGPALQERLAAIVRASEQVAGVGMLNIVTPDLQRACMPDLATVEGQDAIDATIGDSELIIIDNLSCLVRHGGRENESESWLSVQEWALSKRAQGKSVLFVHHAGKNGQQRGTSKREDILWTAPLELEIRSA